MVGYNEGADVVVGSDVVVRFNEGADVVVGSDVGSDAIDTVGSDVVC